MKPLHTILLRMLLNSCLLFSCENFNYEQSTTALNDFHNDFKTLQSQQSAVQPQLHPLGKTLSQGKVLPFNPPPLPPESKPKKFTHEKLGSHVELSDVFDAESDSVVITTQTFLSAESKPGKDFILEGDEEKKAAKLKKIKEYQNTFNQFQQKQLLEKENNTKSITKMIVNFFFRQ